MRKLYGTCAISARGRARIVLIACVSERVPIQEAITREGIGRTAIYRLIRLGLLKKYRTPLDRRTYIDLGELRELRRNPPMREVP